VTVKTFSEIDDRIFYTVFLMADPHYKNFQRSGVGLIYITNHKLQLTTINIINTVY